MQASPVGQLLLTGVPGTTLDKETIRRLKKLQPGGIILFGRNIQSAKQLRQLLDDLRDLMQKEPILTIDQEGGRVSRLRLIGSEPPNAYHLRVKNDHKLVKRHGQLTGELLRLFGFNLNLCPVLDIAYDDEADNSLKGRCYGKDPQQVLDLAGTFNTAMRSRGILSCGKHFPGYAHAEVDPHHELPIIRRSREELEAEEVLPFRTLLPVLDSIMVCHSHYPCFDPDKPRWPASLSENVVQQFLRNQLGYDNGLVMTDDLDMGAILNEISFREAVQTAMRAGNDMVMLCHRLEMAEVGLQHLEELPALFIDSALYRIERCKSTLSKPKKFSEETFHQLNRAIWQLRVDTMGEKAAKILSREDGKRSPVELY